MSVQIQQIYPLDAPPALGREPRFALTRGAFPLVEFFLEKDGIL
jgi:hypothetical protein